MFVIGRNYAKSIEMAANGGSAVPVEKVVESGMNLALVNLGKLNQLQVTTETIAVFSEKSKKDARQNKKTLALLRTEIKEMVTKLRSEKFHLNGKVITKSCSYLYKVIKCFDCIINSKSIQELV